MPRLRNILTSLIFVWILFYPNLNVYSQISANFTVSNASGCSPLTANFTPNTLDSTLNYRWTFGNGNISTEMRPSAIYFIPGNYNVHLVITDRQGNRVEHSENAAVTVFKDPVADFSVNTQNGCRPITVDFKNNTTLGDAPIEKYTWDFGDGNLGNTENPSHLYQGFGNMTIHLHVVDRNGCESSIAKPNLVQVERSPNVKIKAKDNFSCTAPFTFELESESDFVGPNDKYEWTFSDGGKAAGRSVKHTVNQNGEFDVTLTITTPSGCVSTKTFSKFIYIGRYNIDFHVSKNSFCEGEETVFTNNTKPLFGRFKWDLGDGRVINSLHLTVPYNTPGTFSPKLIVEGNANCIDSLVKRDHIRVHPRPKIEIDVVEFSPCPVPATLKVDNLSDVSHSFFWTDNGSLVTPSSRNFIKYIPEYGETALSLVLESIYGCKRDTLMKFKYYPPEIEISADVTEGCAPLSVNFEFEGDSNMTFKHFVWDFGDGTDLDTVSSGFNASHTFQDTGRFLASITGYGPNGCIVTDTIEIRVGKKTNPDFSTLDSFCNGDFLNIQNLTPLDHPYLEYLTWVVFATGSDYAKNPGTSKIQDPTCAIGNGVYRDYNFNYGEGLNREEGYYSVLLQTVHNGCKDTIIKDSVFFVSYPLTIIGMEGNVCDSIVILRNNSIGYHRHEWTVTNINGTRTSTGDTIVVNRRYGGHTVTLVTWNDSTGCRHERTEEIKWFATIDGDIDWRFDLCGMGSVLPIVTLRPPQYATSYMTINDGKFEVQRQSLGGPGKKDISVFIQNMDGCRLRFDTTVYVLGSDLDGVVKEDTGCTPRPVELRAIFNPNEFRDVHWLLDGRKVLVKDSGIINDTIFSAGHNSPKNILIQLIGLDTMGCQIVRNFSSDAFSLENLRINVIKYNECERRRFNFEAFIPDVDLTPFQIRWDFGNGTTGNDIAHVVNYQNEGKYVVKLTVIEPSGCATRIEHHLDLAQEKIVPDFDITMSSNKCPPVYVEFENKTLALNRSLRRVWWDFGDGSFSEVYNPKKIYQTAGEFTVKLYVEDLYGCKDSIIKTGNINIEGPQADAIQDNHKGCVPLTVNFSAKLVNASNWMWDFGDGNVVENVENISHSYTRPGFYLPLLIIKDSSDCQVVIPLDTIQTQDEPKPDFKQLGLCLNQPITFVAQNLNTETDFAELTWIIQDLGNTLVSNKDSFTHQFNTKNPRVKLSMTSSFGCLGEMQRNLNLSAIQPNFSPMEEFNCIGGTLDLINTSTSDAVITEYHWIINGEKFFEKYPNYELNRLGPIPIVLIQKNANGCIDSFFSDALIIGDTINPPNPEILRVTVVDDFSVQFDFKESSQEDFKSYWIFREFDSTYHKIGQVNDRSMNSFIAYNLNPLEHSYCFKLVQENGCGLVSDTIDADPHCTIETKALGELNRNRVNWSEYFGFNDVEAYRIYRRTLDPDDEFKHIATVNGDVTEYIDSQVVCKSVYSYLIEGIEKQGNQQVSFSDTANAKPYWDYSPPPNKLVRATVEDNRDILIEWDSVINSQTKIVSYTLEKSVDGQNYRTIETFPATRFEYLDKAVKVMERSYFYRIYAKDECDNKSPYLNYGKTILLVADSVGFQRPRLNWSTYQGWTEDVDYYTIEIKDSDLGFIEIASTQALDSTFIDEITALNQRPDYCYRVIGHKEMVSGESQVVSVSNVDCSPVFSAITYPNAFTPNGDGLNDTYGTPSFYIKDYHIQIFNRWGEMVFESFDLEDRWDGMYMGKPAQQDAYAVIIHSIGVDLIKRTHFGTITLLR